MSGRHPFRELIRDMAPDRRRRIDAMKRELVALSKPAERPRDGK